MVFCTIIMACPTVCGQVFPCLLQDNAVVAMHLRDVQCFGIMPAPLNILNNQSSQYKTQVYGVGMPPLTNELESTQVGPRFPKGVASQSYQYVESLSHSVVLGKWEAMHQTLVQCSVSQSNNSYPTLVPRVNCGGQNRWSWQRFQRGTTHDLIMPECCETAKMHANNRQYRYR